MRFLGLSPVGTGFIIAGIIIVILIIVVAAYLIGKRNEFVVMRNNNEEAFSTMDIYLKKRYDLIPNIVATVKGYAKHESETLENVIAARNVAQSAQGADGKIKAEKTLQGALDKLMVVVEKYPDLKADAQFIDLSNQLKIMEGEIANSRKFYNANVKKYNTAREVFPSNIVASMFKFDKWTLFEITDAAERNNVKVEF